jgi:hypothetical protein
MAEVPDPISEPEQYRDWLVSLRMADLAAPALEEALGTWIEERAKAGYVVRPFVRSPVSPLLSHRRVCTQRHRHLNVDVNIVVVVSTNSRKS